MTPLSTRTSAVRRSIKPLHIILASTIVLLLVAITILAIIYGPKLFKTDANKPNSVHTVQEIETLWGIKDYQKTIEYSELILANDPLNFDALLYNGFASFYYGNTQETLETKNKYLMSAIGNLRKAKVIEPHRNNGDIDYILGKTYFHLGYFYHDLAYHYLQNALAANQGAKDLREYLGVVASSLEKPEQAIEHFKLAMNDQNRDAILLALASAYVAMEKIEDAAKNIDELLSKTKDPVISLRARFLRAEIYTKTGKNDAAMADYLEILKEDPDSSDAHYYVGEMYFLNGDVVKARAEWRNALILNPKHNGALNRLNTGM